MEQKWVLKILLKCIRKNKVNKIVRYYFKIAWNIAVFLQALRCFAPDSIDEMITSGSNYIIFDYDNKDLLDSNYNRDIILKFNENTRLYRLVTYLSYYKEHILKEDLPKKEFADKIGITGYQYMTYPEGD